MPAKEQTNILIIVALAVACGWIGVRHHVYLIFPAAALALDIMFAWSALPFILHFISRVLLSVGLGSSRVAQKVLYICGLALETVAISIDKINAIIPNNPLCTGAAGRKVMLGAFMHSLEKKTATKKYMSSLVKDLKKGGDNVALADLTSSLTFLAEIAHQEGNYKEAREIAEETLALIDSRKIDPVHKATTLIDMCSTYVKQGLIEESIAIGIRAVDCLDSTNSGHNQLQAIAYNNLSLAYSYAGDYEEALRAARRSFNLKHSANGGRDCISTAIAHSNISDYLIYLGRYDDALNEAKKALTMLDNLDFKSGQLRATVLQNMGSSNLGLGNTAEAKKFLLESLRGKTKYMTEKDPEWSSVYVDLAMLYGALNERSTADGYFLKALNVARKGLGEKHPRLAFIDLKYASFLESSDRQAEAATVRQEAAMINEHWAALKKSRPPA